MRRMYNYQALESSQSELGVPDIPVSPIVPAALQVGERPPFWRRLIAFAADGFILGLVCSVAGLFLGDWFSKLGAWGRVVGGGMGVLYFGFAASPAGGGQTLGKKLTRISVSRPDGTTLSFPSAFARATLLMLPITCNSLAVPPTWWVMTAITSAVILVLGGSILYLFLFNRVTRQATHDLATRSVVSRVGSNGPRPIQGTTWRTHFGILAAIVVLAAGVATLVGLKATKVFNLAALQNVQQHVGSLAHTSSVQVVDGTTWMTRGSEQTWIQTSVMTYSKWTNEEELANSIASIILRDIPTASLDRASSLRSLPATTWYLRALGAHAVGITLRASGKSELNSSNARTRQPPNSCLTRLCLRPTRCSAPR